MKIISFNVNGIRAAVRKGFAEWFQRSKADIVCLQEVRAEVEEIPLSLANPSGYYSYFNPAQKKGYSGVAVYSKKRPLSLKYNLGLKRFDQEGRLIKAEYQDFILINLYIPNGGRRKENMGYKLKVYQYLLNYLQKEESYKPLIFVGDFNIAHQEIDLERPKQNKNNTMFTPEERMQIEKIMNLGFMDTWREFDKSSGNYTWWSNFANARERNIGWRIDYIFISEKLRTKLKKAFIWPKVMGSDHCPVGIEVF